ncbi:MAG TPA: hypothetical protein H9927_05570 [Candidatus Alistipes merdipullorum]|nr:hypothetical protein [Candidatus Alistipes merdipullorum]
MRATIILLAVMMATGCCPCRKAVPTAMRDSVRVETVIRTEYVRDTVLVEVPAEEKAQAVRDTTSHLETTFAESDAAIMPDGVLYHTLRNKPQQHPAEVETKVVYRDSIIYRDRVKTERVEVERDLTWWQQTRLRGFWVLLAVVVWLLRKPVVELVRRFI